MLSIKNISKSFADKKVLENISMNINKGEIVSLLGKSGSGKSTLLNIIAGFEVSDSGSCVYAEQTIFDNKHFVEPQNRNIGFVFQNYALFPHLSVAKNITFGISNRDKEYQKHKASELLELIGMKEMGAKYPHQLSGGQQQRVAIARVLARQSDLILFDEPFSSIDTELKLALIEEITHIVRSQNKTAIFVTHCPREALFISDKIAYIENGTLAQYDEPKELVSSPSCMSITNLFGKNSFMFKEHKIAR
ncbi:MAG: ABC transporter ATP-binding protein [Sulfurovum sp.]|nr:ABC transporter ATP-binding protein [Sulfurovum sp.]